MLSNFQEISKPICIQLEILQNEFWLSVIDQGPGIPEEILPLIFDKFYHAPGATKGLGLGLAIVKVVVDIHRGTIKVKNLKEKGTKFSLILPN